MSIFRIAKDKQNPYLMMNKHALQDDNLSWKAKGILAYLLSLPDDWQIYEKELQTHSKDGKDSLKTGIQELIEAGYIERKRIRNEKGQLKQYEYRVYEVPSRSGFSSVGFSKVGESASTYNYNTEDNNLTNKEINKGSFSSEERTSFSFPEFINLYSVDEEVQQSIFYYLHQYKNYRDKEHPKLTIEQWIRVIDNIMYCPATEYNLDVDDIEKMIDKHFKTKYKNCDYNILHFISEGVKNNRFYDGVY